LISNKPKKLNNMEQTNTTGAVAQRPGFLTALCILTWVGCGFSLIGSIMMYIGAKALTAFAGGVSQLAGESGADAMKEVSNVMTNAYIQLGGGVLGMLLCLIGSIQMWKLSKKGYYMYVAGQVLPIIGMFAFPIAGVQIGAMGYVMGLVGPVLFLVLYGLNLKHMK
jgi:hypothetical protein